MQSISYSPRFGSIIFNAKQCQRNIGKQATDELKEAISQLSVPIKEQHNDEKPVAGIFTALDLMGYDVVIRGKKAARSAVGKKFIVFEIRHKVDSPLIFNFLPGNWLFQGPVKTGLRHLVPGTGIRIAATPGNIAARLRDAVAFGISKVQGQTNTRFERLRNLTALTEHASYRMPEQLENFPAIHTYTK